MKKSKGLIITCSILGALLLIFSLVAILYAFDVQFIINLEWAIFDAGWEEFDLLKYSILICIVLIVAIVAILTISDEKAKKANSRSRRQNKYFE